MNEEKVPSSSEFGRLLRRSRLAAGLSQEALAERAGMSVNGISALERGDRRSPQRQTLALLADALGLSPEERAAFAASAARRSAPRASRDRVDGAPHPRSNLPLSLTSFVGRRIECGDVRGLVTQQRLVTLLGTGGVGKTRTSLEVAQTLADRFADGVWFVELAPIADPGLVTSTVAASLGARASPDRPLLDTVIDAVRRKHILLVVDNCEHVIDEAAQVVDTLLRRAPDLRVIATSREPLRIGGEHTYRLPSLDDDATIDLFVQRARAVDFHFSLDDRNAPLVAAICRRLDGIPLAIELAAARVRTLPLDQLLAMLERSFDVLTHGSRTALPRHQTMRAAIAWSFELLGAAEQHVLERLSIFAGGATRSGVVDVCGGPGAEGDLRLVVASLVDKSLVLPDVTAAEPRYRLLDSIRQFARERLEARGESESIAHRHARFFATHATAILVAGVTDITDLSLGEALRRDLDNWRTAVEWALHGGNDVALGLELAAEFGALASFISPLEGRSLVRDALARTSDETPLGLRSRLEYALALISLTLDDNAGALAAAERSLAGLRALEAPWRVARALFICGSALPWLGRAAEAPPYLAETLDIAKTHGLRRMHATTLHALGVHKTWLKEFADARVFLVSAIAEFSSLGDLSRVAISQGILANIEECHDNYEAAIQLAGEALENLREGSLVSYRRVLLDQANRYIVVGRWDEARRCAREGVGIASDLQMVQAVFTAAQHLAVAIVLDPDSPRLERVQAARMLGYLDASFGAAGPQFDKPQFDRALEELKAAPDPRGLEAAMTEGRSLGEAEALNLASQL